MTSLVWLTSTNSTLGRLHTVTLAIHPILQKARLLKVCVANPPLPVRSFSIMAALHSTPRKNTCNSAAKFAATTQPLNQLQNNMDPETRKNFVGPMPVRKFLDNFLPVQLPPGHLTGLPNFAAMARSRLESQMYGTFVRSLFILPLHIPDCPSIG